MPDIVQFVDSVTSSPTVRLDLNDDLVWGLNYEGTDFSPPPRKTAWASTLLTDGELLAASAYENRQIRLSLDLKKSSVDGVAAELQKLGRELDREVNFLKWQPVGATNLVFFQIFRSAETAVEDYPGDGTFRTVDVVMQAKSAGIGLKETLPQATVYNDPAEGLTLNSNPFFETDASNWSNGQGVAVARTASVAHEGVGSLQITPDGVTSSPRAQSEVIPATAGVTYWASGWLRSNSGTPAVGVRIQWLDAAQVSLGFAGSNVTLNPSTTWIYADTVAAAPANTAFMRLIVPYTGTPAAANVVQADELRIRQVASAGGACFDVTGVKGDVETPLYVKRSFSGVGSESLFAVRRRGTPANTPFVMQAESMTQGVDTATQANSSAFSGPGNNSSRVTFAGTTAYVDRLSAAAWPSVASVDARGQYRVFARLRKNGATSTIKVRLRVDGIDFDEVTVTANTVHMVDLTGQATMSIPAGLDPVCDGPSGVELPVKGSSITLRATRTGGGSDTLDVDHLRFVPADDALTVAHWPVAAGADRLVLGEDETYAILNSTGEIISGTTGWPVNPLMVTPGVTNRIFTINEVAAGLAEPSFPISRTFDLWYWPRYLTVRPATT